MPDGGLSLFTSRRRRLPDGRLSLACRRNILRMSNRSRSGLGMRDLSRLLRSGRGLCLALCKGRRGTGAHGRSYRMHLFGIDRLDLHACGRRILAGDLGAQGL